MTTGTSTKYRDDLDDEHVGAATIPGLVPEYGAHRASRARFVCHRKEPFGAGSKLFDNYQFDDDDEEDDVALSEEAYQQQLAAYVDALHGTHALNLGSHVKRGYVIGPSIGSVVYYEPFTLACEQVPFRHFERDRGWSRVAMNFVSGRPLSDELLDDFSAASLRRNQVLQRCSERIAELWALGRLEDILLDANSATQFLKFVRSLPDPKIPSIFLLDNGDVRAVWKNAGGEQVALQFIGRNQIQYVIFARRNAPPLIARSSGRDTAAGVIAQIENLGIKSLISR